MIGHGHGATFLRLLAERLCTEGAPHVAIDPDVDNLRARRAYAKAGFAKEARVATEGGSAVLMIYDPGRSTSYFAFPSAGFNAPTIPNGAK